ncbi:cysteine desulfurase NifS [bacterium]|nr:cysteine desulfurase NifS [bacterium]
MIYLDHNATTPVDPQVLKEMLPYFSERYHNPSSVCSKSQENRELIETIRHSIASILGAHEDEIFFTSGGTESDNLAIKGVALRNRDKGNHIITSGIEHPAVLEAVKYLGENGFRVDYVPVDRYGIVDLEALEMNIRKDTVLISIMHANNEVGTIQPLEEISKTARREGIIFHTDAVQSVGKLPINVDRLGVDLLSLSGHKLYGPKGIGAIYIRRGIEFYPIIHGGHQERSVRAGTENVPGIVGLGKALELAVKNIEEHNTIIKSLRDMLWDGIKKSIPDVVLNGHPENRLAGTLNVSFRNIEGEAILLALDMAGIAASSGSACSSGSSVPSHVLSAMGLPPEVGRGTVRFSLGHQNTREDIEKVLQVLPGIVQRLRAMSPLSQ